MTRPAAPSALCSDLETQLAREALILARLEAPAQERSAEATDWLELAQAARRYRVSARLKARAADRDFCAQLGLDRWGRPLYNTADNEVFERVAAE